jgi:ATP-dependent 26S proteasome regulatory subunit
MNTLFEVAKTQAPSIIYINDIDLILTKKSSSSENKAAWRLKTEFFDKIDALGKYC